MQMSMEYGEKLKLSFMMEWVLVNNRSYVARRRFGFIKRKKNHHHFRGP